MCVSVCVCECVCACCVGMQATAGDIYACLFTAAQRTSRRTNTEKYEEICGTLKRGYLSLDKMSSVNRIVIRGKDG